MPDLAALFSFGIPPLEIIVRGSAVYWFLFLLFRFVLRRDAGALGIADILLLVLIADASQNAMAGDYTTIADGMLLVATIAGWSWAMDVASYRFKAIGRLTDASALVLVRRGRLVQHNLRREHITTPELMASLREQGIEKLADVKFARMEPDGQISVIRQKRDDASAGPSLSVRPELVEGPEGRRHKPGVTGG